jgi:hypothetical protein
MLHTHKLINKQVVKNVWFDELPPYPLTRCTYRNEQVRADEIPKVIVYRSNQFLRWKKKKKISTRKWGTFIFDWKLFELHCTLLFDNKLENILFVLCAKYENYKLLILLLFARTWKFEYLFNYSTNSNILFQVH